MRVSKPEQLGHFVGNKQFERGKAKLNQKQVKIFKEISRIMHLGQENYLDGELNVYSFKGLVNYLRYNVRFSEVEIKTINASEARQAYTLIEKLKNLDTK